MEREREPKSQQLRKRKEEAGAGTANSSVLTDINANPRVATSTPVRRLGEAGGGSETVSPMSEGPGLEAAEGMATSTMSGSSGASGAQLSQLYTDICEQKDVIMSCLDEDNCDIDQVR